MTALFLWLLYTHNRLWIDAYSCLEKNYDCLAENYIASMKSNKKSCAALKTGSIFHNIVDALNPFH